MNKSLKLVYSILILGSVISLGYFSFNNDFRQSHIAYLVLLILVLTYHFMIDTSVSKVFVGILVLFVIASIIRVALRYNGYKSVILVNAAEMFTTLGLFLMVQELFKEVEIRLAFNKYTLLSLLLLVVNIFIIYKIGALVNKFQLGLSHTAFDFIFTIVKILILSLGLTGYFMSIWKPKKVAILSGSLAMFLISDMSDTLNYLFFIDDLFLEGLFLQYMFLVLGLFLFYKFCTYPNDEVLIND